MVVKNNNMSENKKICYITTLSITSSTFLMSIATKMRDDGGLNVSFASDMTDEFITNNKDKFHLYNIKMERGAKPLGMLKAIYEFYRLFRREKFDMIQYSTPNAAFYASIAGWLAGIKIRLYCQWGIRYVTLQGYRRLIFKFIEKLTAKFSTDIRASSPLNLAFALNEGLYPKHKVKVEGNGGASGVDLDFFDIKKKKEFREELLAKHPELKDRFIFGFVARLNKDKGINELMEAFHIMREKYENISLLIVGGMDKLDTIDMSLYNKSLVSNDVIFIGRTNIVNKYLSLMDILVHPTYREGFGGVSGEAMAMGVPVITTDVPGASEILINGESGILCKSQNMSALLEAMETLYLDEEARRRYSINGYERIVKFFSMDKKTLSLYDDRMSIFNKIKKC